MIVGWGTDDVLIAALDHQQMAILDASDESHAFTALTLVDGLGQRLVQIVYQHAGILRFQIAAVVRDDLVVFYRDDITADGKVVLRHLVAYRCSLQGAATFVHLIQIIAQNSRIGHLRSGRESLGHRHQSSTAAFACQLVHHGFMGILQQRLPPKFRNRQVRHSITQNNNMFHVRYRKSPSLLGGVGVGLNISD